MRVLIGAPVRQDERIFKHYINALRNLKGNFDLFFYLHNSKHLIPYLNRNEYELCESNSVHEAHVWNNQNLSEVTQMKNMLLQKTIKDNYDYFFLVDSDTILHPETLQHLLSRKKDIVAEVLWTRWKSDLAEMPNAWDEDFYSFKNRMPNQHKEKTTDKTQQIIDLMQNLGIKDESSIEKIGKQVFDHLVTVGIEGNGPYQAFRTPGIYKVGGIGGCNLISRKVIDAGVNYSPIYNLSWTNWEDRAFCVRAAVLGFNLYLDTHYPAIHLYNENYLKEYENTLTT